MSITAKDYSCIRLAKKIAKKSKHFKYGFAACIFKGGRLLSVGLNTYAKPKFFLKHVKPNMHHHAEIGALFGLSKKVSKGSTIYIYASTSSGNPVLTFPCPSCLNLIYRMELARIVYTKTDGEIEEYKL